MSAAAKLLRPQTAAQPKNSQTKALTTLPAASTPLASAATFQSRSTTVTIRFTFREKLAILGESNLL